ncbi:hypothetical protein DEU56DRAFT_772935 [Suillus clintonianus]|uniref:uncharacterized protein n=1 Tax=Suillus clintonianus TaxID=1904413 RepID=UPI001B86594C|nr:uncharacterized protein DEU56DRAFT_772935 [Suillus clintonianus]KAG2154092.1 hypothetical protein DEU56DRAFT_772935 [Suillus clintonianus]
MYAIESVVEKPINLIQGPPATGKTVTSTSIVYHLANMNIGQEFVCVPSNMAFDLALLSPTVTYSRKSAVKLLDTSDVLQALKEALLEALIRKPCMHMEELACPTMLTNMRSSSASLTYPSAWCQNNGQCRQCSHTSETSYGACTWSGMAFI